MSQTVDLTQGAKNKVRKSMLLSTAVGALGFHQQPTVKYEMAWPLLGTAGKAPQILGVGMPRGVLGCLLAPMSQMSYFCGACLGPALPGQERLGCVRCFPLGHADP